ncbi:hypothetical protein SFV1gp45 [Sulfolobus filamentous virus 1]|uniref:Uncharacterized protein n=2 Tax=Alphalipothrixvirus beppuense TaxID=2734584 RepID=A0A346LU84_SUFV1|nr:hypothetical protein HOT91_gp45 [Sulfolobus filamentous virus 1]AXQ00127.1 hypothetical protein SFV1gp45 [Sulfolobus filamentous virus 1]AZI75747.1 hypothetical protein SBFV1_gp46 [Sulfolobales Beppu filamentous phage 1]
MSIPIPDEIKPFTKNIQFDVNSQSFIVTISAKLFFSTLLANQTVNQNTTNFNILNVTKANEKIYVYVKPNVNLTDPFEGFEGRFVINQAKLDKMILENAQNVRIYYKQENDDLLILLVVPMGDISAKSPSTSPVGW